jgi:hypothetical protein
MWRVRDLMKLFHDPLVWSGCPRLLTIRLDKDLPSSLSQTRLFSRPFGAPYTLIVMLSQRDKKHTTNI